MKYSIKMWNSAKKDLDKVPVPLRDRIIKVILSLSNNPFIGKKLGGEHEGKRSIRVWPYRILYEIYKNKLLVLVIRIRHRKDVYK